MGEFAVALASALGLGVFTSINPCPLATNIAAISYIGRRVSSSRQVLMTGLLYALGRTLVYLVLGMLLVNSLLAVKETSSFLTSFMKELVGPILILVAMFLLELLDFGTSGPGVSEKMQRRVDALGVWGGLLLGIVFALAFCPTSAMLFFGGLITAATAQESGIAMPSLFGIGTAVPVIVFAFLIAFSAQSVGKAYNRLAQVEWWVRLVAGIVVLAIGIHYSLKYIFEITPFWDPLLQYIISLLW